MFLCDVSPFSKKDNVDQDISSAGIIPNMKIVGAATVFQLNDLDKCSQVMLKRSSDVDGDLLTFGCRFSK